MMGVQGQGGGIVGLMADVWARLRGRVAAERDFSAGSLKAERDPLTQVWSRNALDVTLKTSLAHAARRGERLTLWMIRLDGIVYFGSPAARSEADRLLIEIARTLENSAGPDDTVFRLSGASFAVLLPGRDAIGVARFAAEARTAVVRACRGRAESASISVRASTASAAEAATAAGLIELATGRLEVSIKSALQAAPAAKPRLDLLLE